MLNTQKILKKYVEIKKTAKYLHKIQNEDGSYQSLRPDPITSMFFTGILYELKKTPRNKSTYTWARLLQTGHRGFAEAPGENCWSDRTWWGSEIHRFLKIKPTYENNLVEFIYSHQNPDGGFGSTINTKSNLDSTIYWVNSLICLRYEIKERIKLINFLNQFLYRFKKLSLWHLYHIINILSKLKSAIELKEEIIDHINKNYIQDLSFKKNIDELYYAFSIFLILGNKSLQLDKDFILKCQNPDGGFGLRPYSPSNPQSTYFAIKLLKMLKTDICQKILKYTYKHELKEGGFYDNKDTNVVTALCCTNSLRLLGYKPKYIDKLSLWLLMCQNPDGGFGLRPNSSSLEKATFWSTRALSILENQNFDHHKLINFLNNLQNKVGIFSFYYLTYVYRLLKVVPPNYLKIISTFIEYQNPDGGFGEEKGSSSEMYETLRAVQTIYNIMCCLDNENIPHINFLDIIKKRTLKWIISCENTTGGFSWIPNESSYIQPTYLALNALLDFKGKPINIDNHIRWILLCKNKDGGFRGGLTKCHSYPLFTHYALMSLLILHKMKFNLVEDIDEFIGV